MRDRLAEKAIRAMVSALLSSNMSAEELRQVVGILDDREVWRVVQTTVWEFTNAVPRRERNIRVSSPVREVDPILSAMQKKRLSKQSVLTALHMILPPSAVKEATEEMTLRELAALISKSDTKSRAEIMQALGIDQQDAFVSGILRRGA